MSALQRVRSMLVSRCRVTLPADVTVTIPVTLETHAVPTATTTSRFHFNVVATVWSTETTMDRDVRFNFFSVQTANETDVFKTIAVILGNYGTVRCNEGTKQLAANIPDLAIRNVAARLDSLGVRVRWIRFDGR